MPRGAAMSCPWPLTSIADSELTTFSVARTLLACNHPVTLRALTEEVVNSESAMLVGGQGRLMSALRGTEEPLRC